MASIIKVDEIKEKTQGSGITLGHALKNSSGTEVISETAGTVTLTADEANIGSNALVVAASGNVTLTNDATINGITVGKGAGSISTNTAVGESALSSNTTGSNNTVIGNNAGSSMTTGSNNTIIGAFNGNQDGLDIRTSNNNIVLSDGDGNPIYYVTSYNQIPIKEERLAWNTENGFAEHWTYAFSSFSNPTVDLMTLTSSDSVVFNIVVIRVTVYQTSWAGANANIHEATVMAGQTNSSAITAKTSTMAKTNGSSGMMNNVGTLSWTGSDGDSSRTLQYTTNRISNYDRYNIKVEICFRGNSSNLAETRVTW